MILVFERIFELPGVSHQFKKEQLILSLDELIVFVTLENLIP
jgi:hypothetical protein